MATNEVTAQKDFDSFSYFIYFVLFYWEFFIIIIIFHISAAGVSFVLDLFCRGQPCPRGRAPVHSKTSLLPAPYRAAGCGPPSLWEGNGGEGNWEQPKTLKKREMFHSLSPH